MHIYLTVFVSLFLIGESSYQEPAPEESPIPLERASAMFDLALRLSNADGGALWKASLYGPMLFVDARSRTVVANQADQNGNLKQQGKMWVGTLPADVQPANTSLNWAGVRWTMVLWGALPNSVYGQGRLMMHESLHRLQPQLGLPAASPPNAHLDEENGRAWMRLEMRALAEAMVRLGDERKQAAIDALVFRSMRHQLVGSDAAQQEVALETNEGICEYTGLRLSGLPYHAMPQRAAVVLERMENSPNFSRSFAYATGPAYGFLLDEFDQDWRQTVSKQKDMAGMFAKAVGYSAPQYLRDDAAKRLKKYQGRFVLAEEKSRSATRAARVKELRARFVEGRVLRITTGPDMRYSFNPNRAESLDAKKIVYTPLQASDAWGTLQAPAGAMLDFGSPMAIVLPVPAGATPDNVPWTLKLENGYRLETSGNGNWQIIKSK